MRSRGVELRRAEGGEVRRSLNEIGLNAPGLQHETDDPRDALAAG